MSDDIEPSTLLPMLLTVVNVLLEDVAEKPERLNRAQEIAARDLADVIQRHFKPEPPPPGPHGFDPKDCPTFYDGCNCPEPVSSEREMPAEEIDQWRMALKSHGIPAHKIDALCNMALRSLRSAIQASVTGPDEQGSVYVYFQPERRDEKDAVKRTDPLERYIHVDFDASGKLFGVELLDIPTEIDKS